MAEPLIVLITIAGYGGATLGAAALLLIRMKRNRERLDRLGEELDLGRSGGKLRGMVDGIDVTIELMDRSRLVFQLHDVRIPQHLTLHAPTMFQLASSRDVQTGDAGFDAAVLVQGHRAMALALLDHATRHDVQHQVSAGVAVENQETTWTVKDRTVKDKDWQRAATTLDDLVRLTRRLGLAAEDVPQRLARNALGDPEHAVRQRNLDALQELAPDTAQCQRTCRDALTSDAAEVRVTAAGFLAKRAAYEAVDPELDRQLLAVLTRLATDPSLAWKVREDAVSALCQRRWGDDAAKVLAPLMTDAAVVVGSEAVRGYIELRGVHAVGRLARLLPNAHWKVARAAAEAFGRLGAVEGQRCLLPLLQNDDVDVRLASIEALTRMGDARAVEPLRDLARRASGRETRAIEQAVLMIKARLVGGEPGQLSVAQPAELDGALSTAPDGEAPGALSLDPSSPSEPPADNRDRGALDP